MKNYIDGFVFPISKKHLNEYQQVAESVAKIWKEHGALAYFEYVSDGFKMEGIRSFQEIVEINDNETIVFGWVAFDSKEARDRIHELVANDKRMNDLVAPLMNPSRMIFNAERMVYGGFQPLVHV